MCGKLSRKSPRPAQSGVVGPPPQGRSQPHKSAIMCRFNPLPRPGQDSDGQTFTQVTTLGNPDRFQCDPDGRVRVNPYGVQVPSPPNFPKVGTIGAHVRVMSGSIWAIWELSWMCYIVRRRMAEPPQTGT